MENQDVKPVTPSSGEQEPVVPPVAEPEKPQKPPEGYVPKGALDEERELRKKAQQEAREAREEAERLKTAPSEEPDEVFSDEGKALKTEISGINEKLHSLERKEALREAEAEYPFLKDKKEEFATFLEDDENKRLSIRKAAKLFGVEQGLLESEPQRKGLEKPTGGGQTPPIPSPSAEEIRYWMKNDWKRYQKYLKEGR